MNIPIKKLVLTDAPATVILVRLMVGAVFLSEGIQKFLFPTELGVGRLCQDRHPPAGAHGSVLWASAKSRAECFYCLAFTRDWQQL